MCLISICPAGTEKRSQVVRDFIAAGLGSNGQGSGVAIKKVNEKVVHFKKGFITVEQILAYIDEIEPGVADIMMIHHRIGTQGAQNAFNCHPFVVSRCGAEMVQIEGATAMPVAMHNGVFYHHAGPSNGYFSDTFYWLNEFAATPEFMALLRRDASEYMRFFKSEIGGNKVAFLFPDIHRFITVGNWINTTDGYKHSNSCYYDSNMMNIGGREVKKLSAPSETQSRIGFSYNSEGALDAAEAEFVEEDAVVTAETNIGPSPFREIKDLATAAVGAVVLNMNLGHNGDPIGVNRMKITLENYDKFIFKPKIGARFLSSSAMKFEKDYKIVYDDRLVDKDYNGQVFVKSINEEGYSVIIHLDRLMENCMIRIDPQASNLDIWRDYYWLHSTWSPSKTACKKLIRNLAKNVFNLTMKVSSNKNISTIAVLYFVKSHPQLFKETSQWVLVKDTDILIKSLRAKMLSQRAKELRVNMDKDHGAIKKLKAMIDDGEPATCEKPVDIEELINEVPDYDGPTD